MKSLRRTALRDRVREEVLYRIQRGHLSAETSLHEVDLARRLNVSRTPLREALVALERDGFLTSEPGRGFYVRPLDPSAAEQIFGLLGALESLALRSVAGWPEALVEKLQADNEELRRASPEEYPEFDARFHRRLVAASPNPRLIRAIGGEWEQAKCFQFRLADAASERDHSVREHDAVLTAIGMDAPEAAAELLERHWKNSLRRIMHPNA